MLADGIKLSFHLRQDRIGRSVGGLKPLTSSRKAIEAAFVRISTRGILLCLLRLGF